MCIYKLTLWINYAYSLSYPINQVVFFAIYSKIFFIPQVDVAEFSWDLMGCFFFAWFKTPLLHLTLLKKIKIFKNIFDPPGGCCLASSESSAGRTRCGVLRSCHPTTWRCSVWRRRGRGRRRGGKTSRNKVGGLTSLSARQSGYLELYPCYGPHTGHGIVTNWAVATKWVGWTEIFGQMFHQQEHFFLNWEKGEKWCNFK